MRACFPYFGYKGEVSAYVWERLGNPGNYIEPFAGSLAVLLQRPHEPGREVVNDKAGGLCNFWRAVKDAPEEVAKYALHVLSESDLHARNAFLRDELEGLTARLEGHPRYYDAELAGYWLYVQCLAIGEAAFAKGPWIRDNGLLVHKSKADGIRRAVPCDASRGIQKSIPFHSNQGIFRLGQDPMRVLDQICNRLAGVRILCGDWERAVKPSYSTNHGVTGVFLDPPYDAWATYADSDPMGDRLYEWCKPATQEPKLRVAACGYEGTWIDRLDGLGWDSYAWKAPGGRVTSGGQSDANRERERIKFSPHCLRPEVEGQLSLLGGL